MKPRWLDRTLVRTTFHFTLAASEDAYRKVLDYLNVPHNKRESFQRPGVAASFMQLENKETGGRVGLIMVPPIEGQTPIDVACNIIHEATHAWRAFREAIGEKTPSSEFEAYAMENICRELFEEYVRQTQ